MFTATTRVRFAGRALLLLAAAALTGCGDGSTASTSGTALAGGVATTSSLDLTVSGLPTGIPASITVTYPSGTVRSVTGTGAITGLSAGSHTIAAQAVTVAGTSYAPTPLSQVVTLSRATTSRVAVTYAAVPTTGNLTVNVTMPDATPASVTVTGPNDFTRTITGTTALTSLTPGSYTVTAVPVTGSTLVFSPTPATQSIAVTVGTTAGTTVAYAATAVIPGTEFNLQVLGMTLTQSVQTLTNSVTQITGRPAMLRVFAVANGTNTAKAAVRVRVYANGALMQTLTATNSGSSVPMALVNDSAKASWNVVLPGSLVQPGLSILADVDPTNTVAESDETDNRFPVAGTPQAFTVKSVPTLAVKFVPITQSSTLATGDVTAANAESYLRDTRDILPVNDVTFTVREPYTTSQVLASDGAGWSTTLSELNALRSADQSKDHYYGVVKVAYGSGVAGMGYVGAPASIGWDIMPSGSSTMAHELGHNFGRQHAPCGGVTTSDTKYPYASGSIGQVGYNMRTSTLMPSSMNDLMGYCTPKWISDYNYSAIMNFRGYATAASSSTVSGSVATDGVLVWGRVEADGSIVLEPAVGISAPTVLPARGGEYRLSARDASGTELFGTTFTPVAVSDDVPGVQGAHFAFVLPLDAATYARLERVTVSGRGRTAERAARATPVALAAAASRPDVASESADRVRVKWNAAEYPMVVVRDAASGRILSFARGGNSAFASRRADVDVILTDGVRSVSSRVKVRGR